MYINILQSSDATLLFELQKKSNKKKITTQNFQCCSSSERFIFIFMWERVMSYSPIIQIMN